MKKIITLLLFAIPLPAISATYEIVEKDFVESARAYAKTDEFKKKAKKEIEKKVDEAENYSGEKLSKATYNYSYEVPFTYTLPVEMPKFNKKGEKVGVLYPKGYTFNPILYMQVMPPDMIVYNACDYDETFIMGQILTEIRKQNKEYQLVSTGCPLKKIRTLGYQIPLYILTKEVKDTFKLKDSVSHITIDRKKGVFIVNVQGVKNGNTINIDNKTKVQYESLEARDNYTSF